MKIAHITTVHNRYDIRIFLKQCRSLREAGHDVSLVVADGRGNEIVDGVSIVDVGKASGRFSRMFTSGHRAYRLAKALDADVYHAHDPELIPFVLKLRKEGKIVIFDAHEDLPKQLLSKPYIPKLLRRPLSVVAGFYMYRATRKLNCVVGATASISKVFSACGAEVVTVNNYPFSDELAPIQSNLPKNRQVCYVGGLSRIRGVSQVVEAIEKVDPPCALVVAGPFGEKGLEAELRAMPGWRSVDFKGVISREDVAQLLSKSMAGVVTFLDAPNHRDAQPNKLFEYMSAGIPVIASNFPLWREIVEGNHCGVCVDPSNPDEIARAIVCLIENSVEAETMGANGRRAVLEKYNWESEKQILLDTYSRLAAAFRLPTHS